MDAVSPIAVWFSAGFELCVQCWHLGMCAVLAFRYACSAGILGMCAVLAFRYVCSAGIQVCV